MYIYKALARLLGGANTILSKMITHLKFLGNNVEYSDFRTSGVPYVMSAIGSKGIHIGKTFAMNNSLESNPIGVSTPCVLFSDKGAGIFIGNNVGISQTALIASSDIRIGDNVKIGGGTCIYTTDFHSLDPEIRKSKEDRKCRKSAPITIGDDVFIGAHCIILKGITIGNRSIIGAGSVLTKSVPENEIWAGNPAKFIRKI